jgi:hypothetical protein
MREARAAGAERQRRKYNRRYMKLWRKRRETEGAAGESAPFAAIPERRCWYRCGRAAAETIERIDPRTWQRVRIPYCGFC